jgi:hypothetical protein
VPFGGLKRLSIQINLPDFNSGGDTLERTKQLQVNKSGTALFKEICCRSSLLPLQSLIYAISYVRLSTKSKKVSRASLQSQKLIAPLNTLKALAKLLQSSVEVDPALSYMNAKSAVTNYVGLFYVMDSKELSDYICTASAHTLGTVKPENNLLLLPAMMASTSKPKRAAVSSIEIALYKKPFALLYDASSSALQVMHFRQRMAIEHLPESAAKEFSRSLAKLDSRIHSIERGVINPESDEALKREFIRSAIEFSSAHGSGAIDVVSERFEVHSVKSARMCRLIRKAQR